VSGREKFLLTMLATVFASQVGLLGYGVYECSQHGGLNACPKISETFQNTYGTIVATTLALLTGTALSKPE